MGSEVSTWGIVVCIILYYDSHCRSLMPHNSLSMQTHSNMEHGSTSYPPGLTSSQDWPSSLPRDGGTPAAGCAGGGDGDAESHSAGHLPVVTAAAARHAEQGCSDMLTSCPVVGDRLESGPATSLHQVGNNGPPAQISVVFAQGVPELSIISCVAEWTMNFIPR